MTHDLETEAEGGMIRALLGYGLLNLSGEDLVLLVRPEQFLYNIEQLKGEGWDSLETIYCSYLQEDANRVLLSYRLRSNWRRNEIIAVQVQVGTELYWPSISRLFPNAREIEDDIAKQLAIVFAVS